MKAEAAAFAVLAKDAFTGKQFGRFEVLCKLGEGGMSEVFLAWQKSVGGFHRPVVLKRILDSIRHDKEFLRMFVQEAKITSGLSHGNIAALHDLSQEGPELFMVMEFVPGATLVEVAKACALAREEIPIGLTLAAVRDTALALHYAHTFKDATGRSRPVIHRDIAEKNVMVSLDGTTKLLDFGIARQAGRTCTTQMGMVKGTAGYMSPEQVRGEELDGRTDVFSLGVVLHECLTGHRLFRRDTRVDEVHALLNDPISAPSQRNRKVSMELDSVVLKALSRDRNHRYANAREMALALDRAAAAQMWEPDQRAAFIQKHFAERQQQIQQLLGDPSRTDSGEQLDHGGEPLDYSRPTDPGSPAKQALRDARRTVSVRKVTPDPIVTSSATMALDDETVVGEGESDLERELREAHERETELEGAPARGLLAFKGRRPESALSPALLAIAGTGAVLLAIVLLLILSRL
ncbi:MAG: Serine/threonine kinase [Myxococcaceae bacterium]|nr:Serine/threonine kinase [Myxococcaceae bacterium]